MRTTRTTKRIAAAAMGAVLLVPAAAAAGTFDDVDDSKFYAEPIEWAAANSITTGKTPTQFAPEDNVTRGESVTFLKRYHDNLVQPALDGIPTLYWATLRGDGTVAASSPGVSTDPAETGLVDADPGEYKVKFDLDTVADCHAMASLMSTQGQGGVPGRSIRGVQWTGDDASLYVVTADSNGASVSSTFTVQLWC